MILPRNCTHSFVKTLQSADGTPKISLKLAGTFFCFVLHAKQVVTSNYSNTAGVTNTYATRIQNILARPKSTYKQVPVIYFRRLEERQEILSKVMAISVIHK